MNLKTGVIPNFGVTPVLFNGLINKGVDRPYSNPDFAKSEAALSKTMFERRRRRSEFGFAPPEISSKIAGFEYSLDLFGSFYIKVKRTKEIHYQHFTLCPANKNPEFFQLEKFRLYVCRIEVNWG